MPYRPLDDWMWARAFELLNEADRRSRQFFEVRSEERAWQAPVDVYQQGADLLVWVAMPGVAPERVEVALEGRVLRVRGVRALTEPRSAVIRRLEIPYGRFERQLELPAAGYVIVEQAAAHGCVRLRLRHE